MQSSESMFSIVFSTILCQVWNINVPVLDNFAEKARQRWNPQFEFRGVIVLAIAALVSELALRCGKIQKLN